ncbi:MAG: hypothetical protein ACE5Q6_12730, partial [Dehalococcoidia bacterium]
AHAAELAHHFVEAEAVAGLDKLVHYSLLAGERALSIYAHEEALAHFLRALVAKEGQPIDAETADLLFGLGRAQAATLDRLELAEALVTLRRAFEYYAEVGDLVHAVRVAEYPLPAAAGHLKETTQLIARALALVPPDSREAGSLLSHHGRALVMTEGDYEGAQEAFGQAMAIAQREGDETLERRTLVFAAQAEHIHLHYQACVEMNLRAIEQARQADDPNTEVYARFFAAYILMALGDFEGARRHASAMLPVAERLHNRYWLAAALGINGSVSQREGDWQAARDFSDRGLEVSPMEGRLLIDRVLLEHEVGEFARGEAHLKSLVEAMELTKPGPTQEYALTALVIPIIARISGLAERIDVAEAAAQTVLSAPLAQPNFALQARIGLAMIAVQQGNVVAAEEQYPALEPQRGTMAVVGCVCMDRLLGILSQTVGNLQQATSHFDDSLAFCRRIGARPELAWTCCDYADALLHRNNPGDRERAMSLLDESLAISTELGMRPLLERGLSRRDILKA